MQHLLEPLRAGLGAEPEPDLLRPATTGCRSPSTARSTGGSPGSGCPRAAPPPPARRAAACRPRPATRGPGGPPRPGRPCRAGSRTCTTRSKPVPGTSCAAPVSKRVRRSTPASMAAARAASIEGPSMSYPTNDECSNALARMIVEAPRPQPDVDHARAVAELLDDAVERREPGLHEVGLVAGAEQAQDAGVESVVVVAPADALAGGERADEGLVVGEAGGDGLEGAAQEDRAGLVGEHERVLSASARRCRRQGDRPRSRRRPGWTSHSCT